jgi:hypothetical protein
MQRLNNIALEVMLAYNMWNAHKVMLAYNMWNAHLVHTFGYLLHVDMLRGLSHVLGLSFAAFNFDSLNVSIMT